MKKIIVALTAAIGLVIVGCTPPPPPPPPPPTTTRPPVTTLPPPPTTLPPASGAPKYFSSTSLWNTAIPASVNWTDYAPIRQANWYISNEEYSIPVVHSKPTDPVVAVTVPATWGWPAGTINVRIPATQGGAAGTDKSLIVIDGTTAYDFWIFEKTSTTTATARAWAKDDIRTGTGWGTTNPWRAAGIRAGGSSNLAGLIVDDELRTGINHALAFGMAVDPPCPSPNGYVPPAISGDGPCEGLRFGIPANRAMPSGMSIQGQNVWRALQKYGGFSADNAGGVAPVVLNADPNSVPDSDILPLFNDFPKIIPHVQMIR